jgi:hypothetical protein
VCARSNHAALHHAYRYFAGSAFCLCLRPAQHSSSRWSRRVCVTAYSSECFSSRRHCCSKNLPYNGINQLRRQMGLSAIDDFWDQVRGAGRTLLLTSRSFDFAAELPGHVRYVGAVLDAAPGRPWALPTGQDPIVLVAMSSTFQNHVRGLERIIEGLTTLPVRGIATIGPALDPTRFRAHEQRQHRVGRTAFRDSQACRRGGDAWRIRSSVLGVVAKTESSEPAA